MALTGTMLDTPELCTPHLPAWDALATAAQRPFCAPAWMFTDDQFDAYATRLRPRWRELERRERKLAREHEIETTAIASGGPRA